MLLIKIQTSTRKWISDANLEELHAGLVLEKASLPMDILFFRIYYKQVATCIRIVYTGLSIRTVYSFFGLASRQQN